jgi:hypothetical protein
MGKSMIYDFHLSFIFMILSFSEKLESRFSVRLLHHPPKRSSVSDCLFVALRLWQKGRVISTTGTEN